MHKRLMVLGEGRGEGEEGRRRRGGGWGKTPLLKIDYHTNATEKIVRMGGRVARRLFHTAPKQHL